MSDWIEWNGGGCPVEDGTMVYVKFNGYMATSKKPENAGGFRWSHDGGCGDIIAYRLAESAAEPEAPEMPDLVNAPPHYKQGAIECIDAIRSALTADEFRGHCKANAIKYIWRESHKGGDESIRKAIWYLTEMLK